jgi:hypothetical protein
MNLATGEERRAWKQSGGNVNVKIQRQTLNNLPGVGGGGGILELNSGWSLNNPTVDIHLLCTGVQTTVFSAKHYFGAKAIFEYSCLDAKDPKDWDIH